MKSRQSPIPPPLQFIQHNSELFARCGAVVASYRSKNGRRYGPYYRLAYLEQGRQRSLYLGRSKRLAQQAQNLLAQLQKPRNDRRALAQAARQRKTNLLHAKRHLQHTLRAYGLYTRGWVVRGFRARGFPRIDKITPEQKVPDTLPTPSPEKPTIANNHQKPRSTRRTLATHSLQHKTRHSPRYRQNRPAVDQLPVTRLPAPENPITHNLPNPRNPLPRAPPPHQIPAKSHRR